MKNILVIEDSKTMNNIITNELSSLGFSVSQSFSLRESKEFLSKKKYQLIILDLHLPDGEGSELIANIQSLTKTKVIVLTSFQDDDLREELFQYGILDYIVKDKNLLYSISEIVKIIHTIIEKQKDKILIVDDSKFICKQIKTILEPRNYKVTKAYDAKKALFYLNKEKFDLMILDMQMPDMHGMQLLEIIRKDIRFISLPIIILSGTSTPEIVRNCLKNGASDFLKKPFVFEEFILKVDLWIDYFKKENKLKEQSKKLSDMNNNLQKLVDEEVAKNHQKNTLIFAKSRHAQMGEMLAMIAHQWRQPLNAISMAVSLLDTRIQTQKLDKETAKNITSKINEYIQHLSMTIDDFRDFFKPQREAKLSSFEPIIDRALVIMGDMFKKKRIDLQIEKKEIQELKIYENELVQVVLNLLKNSHDALLSNNIQNPSIKIIIDKNILKIKDNAGGIDEKILDKIFDPYFSTKDKNGMGLGLYMSKTIIEEHCKGRLEAKNTNDGVVFSVILPTQEGVL